MKEHEGLKKQDRTNVSGGVSQGILLPPHYPSLHSTFSRALEFWTFSPTKSLQQATYLDESW